MLDDDDDDEETFTSTGTTDAFEVGEVSPKIRDKEEAPRGSFESWICKGAARKEMAIQSKKNEMGVLTIEARITIKITVV